MADQIGRITEMTAAQETYELMRDLEARGLSVSFEDANTLRRAALTLHRWAELECGDGDDYKSWAIERDEETGIPYMRIYPHQGEPHGYRIPDRETGALKRVAEVCTRIGAHYYHQTDPRGAALRIDRAPIPENDYTRAVAV
jgi:hypothetical protein